MTPSLVRGCTSEDAMPSVLVVDDEELLRASLSQALNRMGYTAITAKNGGEALEILEREFIPILLLDIFMPERDGLETLRVARRISPHTRVAVMSGHCGKFDYLDAGLKLCADEAVRKPVANSDLTSVMKRLRSAATVSAFDDRRSTLRINTHLEGQLFNPANWKNTPCRVLNLSEGGALVECLGQEQLSQEIVLYVANFGRFEATVAHRSPNLAGVAFKTGEAERNRLKEMLKIYVESSTGPSTPIRKYPRIKADGKVTMLLASGQSSQCNVLDISSDGVSLKTSMRPSIGEAVCIGEIRGCVIRHHAEGIALKFDR